MSDSRGFVNAEEDPEVDESSQDLPGTSVGTEGTDANVMERKLSKATKVLTTVASKASGKDPQEVFDMLSSRVKDVQPELKQIDPDKMQKLIGELRLKDALDGGSVLGGKNRKDIGEHKVCLHHISQFALCFPNGAVIVLENATCAAAWYDHNL